MGDWGMRPAGSCGEPTKRLFAFTARKCQLQCCHTYRAGDARTPLQVRIRALAATAARALGFQFRLLNLLRRLHDVQVFRFYEDAVLELFWAGERVDPGAPGVRLDSLLPKERRVNQGGPEGRAQDLGELVLLLLVAVHLHAQDDRVRRGHERVLCDREQGVACRQLGRQRAAVVDERLIGAVPDVDCEPCPSLQSAYER